MANEEKVSLQQVQDSTQAFMQVLLKLEQRTLKDCRVASIGIVREYNSTSRIAKVELIPKYESEAEQLVEVYNGVSGSMSLNQLVVVLFTDRFSRNAISMAKSNITQANLNSQSELHSLMNGIIILKVS